MIRFRKAKASILDRGSSKFQKEAFHLYETRKQYTTPILVIVESPWGPWRALKEPLGGFYENLVSSRGPWELQNWGFVDAKCDFANSEQLFTMWKMAFRIYETSILEILIESKKLLKPTKISKIDVS